MKIFLSYGHDINELLVNRIKDDLAAQGHEVWIDTTDIKAGDDWRHSITDGISNSEGVLAFLSAHSVRDPGVCRDELTIALGMKSGAIKTVLLESPDHVKSPLSVSHIQYLDMSEWPQHYDAGTQQWDVWYQEKLKEILRVITHPDSQKFAGEIEILKEKLKPVPYAPRVGQLLKQGFIGREWLKDQIDNWRTNSRESKVFCITGDPGIGKSAFMANLSTVSKAEVVGVHFCEVNKPNDSSPASVIRSLACQMATRLPDFRRFLLVELEKIDMDLDKLTPDELFDRLISGPAVHVIDGGRERYLLLLDALDESGPDLVRILTQKKDQLPAWLGVVVTSRPNEPTIQPFLEGLYPVEVQADGEENIQDARKYIKQWLGLVVPTLSPERKNELTKALLITSAGSFLWLSIFRVEVKKNPKLLDDPEAYPRGLTALYYAFFVRLFGDLNIDKTQKKHYQDYQKPMLRLLVASRQALPDVWLKQILKWDKETLEIEVLRPLGSLFKREQNSISAYHKSITDFLTNPQRSGVFYVDSEQGHLQLAQVLWSAFIKADGNADKLPDYLLYELPFQMAKVSQEERSGIVGGVEGWHAHSQLVKKVYLTANEKLIAKVYLKANENILWKLAQSWSAIEVQLNDELLGVDHQSTARSLNYLALALQNQDNFSAALPLYERALAINEKVLGPAHPDTATSLNNLAELFEKMENYGEAFPLYKRALAINEKELGPEHADTADSLNNLAVLFSRQGDHSAALPLYERALAINEKVLGPEHPYIVNSLNHLAEISQEIGDYATALPLYKRALAINEKVLGSEHPDTVISLNNLAGLFKSQGNGGAALPLYERALAIYEKVLGPEHPYIVNSLNNLAKISQEIGDYATALPLYERALAIREKVLGPEHPDTAAALNNLAYLFNSQGNAGAALPLYERALAIYEKAQGENHKNTLIVLFNLSKCFESMGDYTAARASYERLLSIYQKTLGIDHEESKKIEEILHNLPAQ
ncbi:MAG: toll/interleukin-1 receptor domain-containing protein [Methylococcaceae bacterium]